MSQTKTYSEQSIVEAIQGTRIVNLDGLKEIGVLLIELFTMTSLKVESRPNELEFKYLTQKVKQKFGMFRLDEIRLAFELGVTRDLEHFFAKNESIKHYGTFSLEYFGSVMKAYSRYKNEQMKPLLKKISSMPNFKEVSDYDFLKSNFIDQFNKFKDGGYPWNYGADIMIFDLLVKHGIVIVNEDDKLEKSREVNRALKRSKFENDKLHRAEWSRQVKKYFFTRYINEVKDFDLDINSIIEKIK